MNTRTLLKILSVLLLVVGTAMAVGNLVFVGWATMAAAGLRAPLASDAPVLVLIILGALLSGVGATLAYRAWTHLRQPDASTARDVISFTLYVAAFAALSPFLRHHPYPTFVVVIGLVFLRRYLTKRFAAQFAGVH
jgi:hypothetical protein